MFLLLSFHNVLFEINFPFQDIFFPLKRWAGSHCLRELQPQEEFYSYQEFLSLMMLWTSPAHETHPHRAIHGGQEDKWTEREQQSECLLAYISIGGRLHVICSSVLLAKRRVHHVNWCLVCVRAHTSTWICMCICVSVLWLPLRGDDGAVSRLIQPSG